MYTHKYLSVLLACALAGTITAQTPSLPKLGKDPVDKVVAAMSLEEKASLVVGMGMNMPGINTGAPVIGDTAELVPGAAGTTYGLERLGIPRMVLADGPAGLRINPTRPGDENTFYCTGFPVGTLLASTWDTELLHKVGEAMGNEVREYGADILLAPGMNIQKNPLCGRNFEYYSEDPYVTGKMAAALVNGIESQGVGTSIKHFAVNNAETSRMSLNTFVSERALREIYLEGFRIAVQESQPWTVMSAFNLINGTYASENRDLLTDVLRGDWGFKGLVMTDWYAGADPVAQMKAGNDLIMPGSAKLTKAIIEAVHDGRLSAKQLDENVGRILGVIQMSPHFKDYKYTNKPDLKAHALITRQSASEGIVLLKNDSALPLSPEIKKVAVFGCTSYRIIAGGTGSGNVNKAYTVDIADGLRNAGYSPSEGLRALYTGYLSAALEGMPPPKGIMAIMGMTTPVAELLINPDVAKSMARAADVAVITIGRTAGEGRDRSRGEGDFELNAAERELIKNVTSAFHDRGKKVIVVLNIGGVIETESWRATPDAILLAWQGGQECGNSVADILGGKVNPSGKLAVSFPAKYADVPSATTFPGKVLTQVGAVAMGFMSVQPAEVTYDDGIYIGYRYYETFKVQPSYEFGFGLSYTTFEYSGLKLSSSTFEDKLTVTVDVKNTGKQAGKEVVELYLNAPTKKLDKPVIELKGFAKTHLLQPGETQTLTFTLDARSLASFDPSVSSWIADQGVYTVKIGASSEDIRQQATFTLAKNMTVKKESVALVPKVKVHEIKSTPDK